jgi:hypothetical protein
MTRLLQSLALTSVLQYPLRVKHTTERVPDFQLVGANCRIAVELTRIKFQDVDHGRALQQRGEGGTLVVSNLYPRKDGPRKKRDVIEEGFNTPSMVFPSSRNEDERIWLTQVRESLDTKTRAAGRKDFAHGDEDWLVLQDPVGMDRLEILNLRDSFSQMLAAFWKPGWFSRVFLQDNFFRWQVVFTAHQFSMLPKYKE